MKPSIVTGLVVAALGCTAASPAFAQENYRQTVRNEIGRHESDILSNGYQRDRDLLSGSLRQGAQENTMIQLQAGVSYNIQGACDEDCSDFDLRIFDPSGNQLAEDVGTDDWPRLTFTATSTGQYRMVALMPGCSTSPCYWGAQVYRR